MQTVSKLIIGLLFFSAFPVQADRPFLLIHIPYNEYLRSLSILSSHEWNRSSVKNTIESGDYSLMPVPLDGNTVDKLAEANVFFNNKGHKEVKREYALLNDKIRVVMKFPEGETFGRRMTDNLRVELSVYVGDKKVFFSKYFGQKDETYTALPKSGLWFRPFSLEIGNRDGAYPDYLSVCGEYATRNYGVPWERNASKDPALWDRPNRYNCMRISLINQTEVFDDDKMNQMALSIEAEYKKVICDTQENECQNKEAEKNK